MVTIRERNILGGKNIEIKGKSPFSVLVMVTKDGKVTLRSGVGVPVQTTTIEKIKEDPIEENFKRALANAAVSLIVNNLPEPYNQSEDVTDKLNTLDHATRAWLDRGRGRKELSITIGTSIHDLGLLAEFQNVNPNMFDASMKRLEVEIEKTVNNYRERGYQRMALRTKAL